MLMLTDKTVTIKQQSIENQKIKCFNEHSLKSTDTLYYYYREEKHNKKTDEKS